MSSRKTPSPRCRRSGERLANAVAPRMAAGAAPTTNHLTAPMSTTARFTQTRDHVCIITAMVAMGIASRMPTANVSAGIIMMAEPSPASPPTTAAANAATASPATTSGSIA